MNARQSDKSETLWIYLWLICLGQAILEMRAVQCTDPSIWDSFSSETRPGLCQNIPMCCLSDVLDPCPVRGILALSAKGDWWIKHLSGKKKKKNREKEKQLSSLFKTGIPLEYQWPCFFFFFCFFQWYIRTRSTLKKLWCLVLCAVDLHCS